MNDPIERISRPDPNAPLTEAEKQRTVMRFILINLVGVAAFFLFIVAFFVLDWFPGRPTAVLVAGILAFVVYDAFAMWASGFWAMIRNTSKTNAGR